MSVIDIQPASLLKNERSVRTTPVYLVVIENPASKNKISRFLATKLDESVAVVRIIGVEILDEKKDLSLHYQEILNSTDKALFQEIMLPWQRVLRVQNLIFKHK